MIAQGVNDAFTIIMLPDTQNAIDFRRQMAEGFAINSGDIFIEQMEYIANVRSWPNGQTGNIESRIFN